MRPLPPCECGQGRLAALCPRHGLRSREATNQARPRKGLRAESDKQALENSRWAGVKDGMLHMARKLDPDGPTCEECGAAGDARTLDLDHVYPRSKGGKSQAANARFLCNAVNHRGRNCHGQRHGLPMWSSNG